MFGRERTEDEVAGISADILLVRAADESVRDNGQDGGLVSAILIWALEHDVIDAALVSALEGDGTTWKAVPAVARTRARSWPRPDRATPTRPTPWPTPTPSKGEPRRSPWSA